MTVELGANPHGVLGAHEAEDGVVVRTYRPEAVGVRVRTSDNLSQAELKDPAGLWEALLPKASLPLDYELDNRPDWVGIPVAGIERLMQQAAEAI